MVEGNAVKYVAHFRFSDGVHIPAWQQHKIQSSKKSPQALNNLFFAAGCSVLRPK